MKILKTLAGVKSESAVIVIGNVRLGVGESDRRAAVLLMDFLGDPKNQELKNKEAETQLIMKWVRTILENSDQDGNEKFSDVLDKPNSLALWDAIFWFRFMSALEPLNSAENTSVDLSDSTPESKSP